MDIISNIEKIMKEKKITAYMLEKDIGLNQATFRGWKRGSQPAIDKLLLVIKYLDITPNEALGYDIRLMSDLEKDMIYKFRKLPELEQIKFIGRIEDKVSEIEKSGNNKGELSNLKSG